MSRCQSNGRCEFWTWIKPTYTGRHGIGARKTCHLKSDNGGRKTTQGLISGNRICNSGCLEEDNIDYDGNDIQILPNIPSKAECMSRCQSNGRCKFWTWIKPTYNGRHGIGARKTCHLKSDNGGRKTTQGLISGNKICNSGCLDDEDNVDYDGNDIQILRNIPSKAECMSRCQSNRRCEFWTWIKPTYTGRHGTGARKKCHLKSNNRGRKPTQGLISGTKICNM